MRKRDVLTSFGKALGRFLAFFSVIAFVVTCTTMLFVTTLVNTLGISLTAADVNAAAKLTFINAVILSLLFTVIDTIRRHLTVERVANKITAAAERITHGDFSVRIDSAKMLGTDEAFGEVIDCFNKMAEELSGVEALRVDVISSVSHEMKTPLAVIQNYARLLETPGISREEQIEYAAAISQACRRLSDMMTNILKLNKLENQQIFPKTEEYDLGEQLCECLLQFENVWESENINIETDIAEGVTVCADTELLSLVWNNLLSNAFKFTGEGGTVSVSLTATEHHATVTISDTGCGMSADVGAHIFEKFYQGDTSRATEGNGLGLALVRRVVDIVHGQISVKSSLGVGSSFTVTVRRS